MIDALTNAFTSVPVRWSDLIDIAVVAFLIYEFLKLIRHTRAVQIIVGGSLVVGIYYISDLLTLRTVNWIVGDMFGYVVFAAIVLFQADIRRGLSRFGRGPVLGYFQRRATTDETIEEVVMAATTLASHNIGALIAIARETGLRTYVDSGILIDSRVTYDLLVSVFQSNSPLHDGAVIIQDNRVAAAACFLPLTVNTQGIQFGTRHRAAIGLTEESDSVAVVVSEETGTVSLVLDGEVEGNLDADQLTYRLEALMQKNLLRRHKFDKRVVR